MIWPNRGTASSVYYASARLKQVVSDEITGTLRIQAVLDEREEQELVYEGMYYSQLDENSVGLIVTLAAEITPSQLLEPEYQQAAARLYEECGADEDFLWTMHKRGNRLYMHFTDRGQYLVLAKHLKLESQMPTANISK